MKKILNFLVALVLIACVNLININLVGNSGKDIKIGLDALKKAMAWETEGQVDQLVGHEEQFDTWLHDDIDIALGTCVQYCSQAASDLAQTWNDAVGDNEHYAGRDAGSIGSTIGAVTATYNIKDCDPGGSGC